MEKELGVDVIKATQTSLGKYVKRPPLTEKLLRKPPFRFLHDIVSAVHKTTGFFEGLFEEDELVSDNVKDRESKIIFLNKVISVIGLTTGKPLSVKSSKIVAGQEPGKTNELLQCLASALDKKLSSDEAVIKYKENLKAPVSSKPKEKDTDKSVKKTNDTKKLNSKSSEKLTTTKKELGTVNKSNVTNNEQNSKKKDTTVTKNEILPKKQQPKIKRASITSSIEPVPVIDTKEKQIVNDNETKIEEDNRNEHEENIQSNVSLKTEINDNDNQNNSNAAKGFIIQSIAQESDGEPNSSSTTGVENELNSSLSSQDLMDIKNADKLPITIEEIRTYDINSDNFANDKKDTCKQVESFPVKNIEPFLSRNISTDSTDKNNEMDKSKTIDKVVRKNSDIIRPSSVRPSSSRPGAPRLREKIDNVLSENDTSLLLAKVNIIAESLNNEEEEDKSIIVVEQHIDNESTIVSQQDQDLVQLLSNEHGHLVQQILDSQKEFSQIGKTEIEWQFGAQKVKETVNQEIEQLRFNIQALSRMANPLGKLLDHIQEDAEVMRQELQQWTTAYDEVFKEMQKQKMANEETLVPLQTRIKQLDMDIQEKHDKIDDLKILIHKNTSRIEKLLINGNVQ